MDVSVPRAWKPAAAAYGYATATLGVDPAAALLAVHPRDIDGAPPLRDYRPHGCADMPPNTRP
jgi:hypothetical protein